MDKNRANKLGPTVATFALSLFAGILAGVWANSLDPDGTSSILVIPVIISLFLTCIALFATGIITRNHSFGLYLMIASILILVTYFISLPILRSIF